eukprot:5462749-Amphidinium_carterae.1
MRRGWSAGGQTGLSKKYGVDISSWLLSTRSPTSEAIEQSETFCPLMSLMLGAWSTTVFTCMGNGCKADTSASFSRCACTLASLQFQHQLGPHHSTHVARNKYCHICMIGCFLQLVLATAINYFEVQGFCLNAAVFKPPENKQLCNCTFFVNAGTAPQDIQQMP